MGFYKDEPKRVEEAGSPRDCSQFFWELSDLFSATIDGCEITSRQKKLLKEKYDNMENGKINQVINAVTKLEKQRGKRIN